MKRYALTFTLLIFVVGAIGAYYAYSASDRLPEYKLATLEGDASEADAIALFGSYGGRLRSELLTVAADGAEYERDQSFIWKNTVGGRSLYDDDPAISRLVRDHREFMRGKHLPSGLYEDKEWLLYAEASEGSALSFKLDLLELKSGANKRFTVTPEGQPGESASYVADVQRIGDQVHLLTYTSHVVSHRTGTSIAQTADGQEYNDYIVELSTGKLLRKVHIDYGLKPPQDVQLRESMPAGQYAEPGAYALFNVNEERVKPGDAYAHDSSTTVGSHLYIYSYKTGKIAAQSGKLIERVMRGNGTIGMEGERIFNMTDDASSRDLYQFDLATGDQIGEKKTITARQLGADKLGSSLMRDGRIYILLHKGNVPQVAVLDAESGSVLYKGETKFMGQPADAKKEMDLLTLLNLKFRT